MRVAVTVGLVLLLVPLAAQDRSQGTLVPGSMATDFTLPPLDGGAPVTLSSFRGVKPAALVFGSYT